MTIRHPLILCSCMHIYVYSCLELLTNRPEAVLRQQNTCTNHELHVCQPLIKHSFRVNLIPKFEQWRSFSHVTKWPTINNFYRFKLSLLCYCRFYFNRIIVKNARIVITHVYCSALTLAVTLRSSLSPQPGGLGFKQLPRATAMVNV